MVGNKRYLPMVVTKCLCLLNRTAAADIPHFSVHTQPAERPVLVNDEPQLFLDDYLIAHSSNLVKTTHTPERALDYPILGWQQGTSQPYVTVLRDPETKLFRMWYNRDAGQIAYAESDDGINWRTPELDILGNDNRLLQIGRDFQNGCGASVIDDGPASKDPNQRFKIAWWGQTKPWPGGDPGMRVAFSSDGIDWKLYTDNPVLPDFGEDHFLGDPRRPYGAGDIIDVFYDPYRNHYGAFVKTPAIASDGLARGPKARTYIRRLVSASTSDDFQHWKRLWRVVVPESRDEGLLEFYSVGGTFARGGLLIGFVRMLRDDLPATEGGPAEGIGYTTLITSRDGKHWERHDNVFFDRHPDPKAWDHAMTWVGSVLPVGDQLYLYYGGYKQGHKIESRKERQIGLARMPKDRFVSRDTVGNQQDVLRTVAIDPSVTVPRRLLLNARCPGGEIRVQVRAGNTGDVIAGYDWDVCRPVSGDGYNLLVTWNELGTLPDRRIQLEFKLKQAELFAFQVTH